MTSSISTELFGQNVSVELSAPWSAYWLLVLRLLTGWWIFHAGLDKLVAPEPFSATG
jgi:thiosulfate dehydrogenase [quinone] large subunit